MKLAKETGNEGEELACKFLQKEGYEVLDRNWRNAKLELDIVALDENFLVVVEVKTRSTGKFGPAQEFLSRRQQNRIIKAAHEYILEKDLDLEVRFDVIGITGLNGTTEIIHFKDAFYPGV